MTDGKTFIFRIYIVALVLRLIPVFLSRGLGIGLDDMFQYDMLARSIAVGNGFRWYAQVDLNQLASFVDFDLSSAKEYDPTLGIPTSFRAPLYPAFLAMVYFIGGTGFSRFFVARLAQVILVGAPLAPLTYLIAKKIFPDNEKGSRVAAWVVTTYPLLLVYPLGLGTENPFFILFLASYYFLVSCIDEPADKPFIIAGLFLGLTALTRSVILPFAGLATLWIWFSLKNKRGAVIVALVFGLTISPWMIRNSLLHHKLTGIETSLGYNLYLGYHPKGNGSFVFGPSLDLLTILDDAQRDKVGTRQAIEFIRNQPERFVPLVVNRLSFFWGLEKRVLVYFYSNNIIGYIPPPWLVLLSFVLLLPFVIVGISGFLGVSFVSWVPQHQLWFLLVSGYLLPHILILAEDRFHLVLVPLLAILAAQLWTQGYTGLRLRWHDSGEGKLFIILGSILAILLIVNWGWELIRDWDKIAQLLSPNGNQTYFPY